MPSDQDDYDNRVFLLGLFCLEFAVTESFLHDTVRRLSGLTGKMHQVFFSGLRAHDAMSYIRRLLEANDRPESIYQETFTHLTDVLAARNMILHHGLTVRPGPGLVPHQEIVVTNSRLALSEWRVQAIPFTTDTLQSLLMDAHKVNARLSRELVRLAPSEHVQYAGEALGQPWRYTPPPQPSPPNKSHPQKAKRPPDNG